MDDHTYSRELSQRGFDRIKILSHFSLDSNSEFQGANFSNIKKEFDAEHNLPATEALAQGTEIQASSYTEDIEDGRVVLHESDLPNGTRDEERPVIKFETCSDETYEGRAAEETSYESDAGRYSQNGEVNELQVQQSHLVVSLKEEVPEEEERHEQTAGEAIESQMQLMGYMYEQNDDNARDVDGLEEGAQMENAEAYQLANWQDTNSQELVDACNLQEDTSNLQIVDQSSEDYSFDDGSTHINITHGDGELQIIGESPSEEYALQDDSAHVKQQLQVASKKEKQSNLIKMFKCTICQFETRHESRLVDHFNEKHDIITKLYRCSHCGDETRKRLAIKKVINMRQRNPTVYRCRYCEYVSNEKSYLQAHINHRHNTDLFLCTFCKYSSTVLDELSKHVTLNHYHCDDTFRCSECSFQATADLELSTHYADVHDICVELLKWSQQLIGVKCKCIANVENCEQEDQGNVCTANEIEVFRCYTCGEETRFKPYKPYQTITVRTADIVHPPKAKTQSYHNVQNVVPPLDKVQRLPPTKIVLRKVPSMPGLQRKPPPKKEEAPKGQTYTNMKCCKCDFYPRDEEELVKHYQDDHIMVLDNNTKTRRKSGEVKRRTQAVRPQEPPHKRQSLEEQVEEKFGCSNCGFRSRFRLHLVNHLLYCKQPKTFTCGQCGYVTDCAADVVEHTRNEHGELVEFTDVVDANNQVHIQDAQNHIPIDPGQTMENMKAVESITEMDAAQNDPSSIQDTAAEVSCMQCSFKAHDEDQLITHIRTRHVLSFKLQKNANDFQITN